jgi:hypothetical protein
MVANGEKSIGQHVTSLPFPSLSSKARQADTFKEFPTSLMSVGKTADDGKISVFTKDGVTVHNEKDTSSHAKTNHCSLEYGANTVGIAFH